MSCSTAESGIVCTRVVMIAGMLASAVAAFFVLSRFREAGTSMPTIPDAGDEINGM